MPSFATSPGKREISRGLTLLVILLPLFFFPELINLYRLPKEALLAFLAAVLTWLWLLTFARQPGNGEGIRLPLLLPLTVYLVLNAISLTGALNLYEGLRHVFYVVIGLGLFWTAANAIDRERTIALFHWITITGTLVSLLGIIQAWGAEIPYLVQVALPSSTFGNKNMAAQFMLFALPAAYVHFFSAREPAKEYLYAGMASLITTYLIYTGTRAAWGATAFSLAVLWLVLRAKGSGEGISSLDRRKRVLLLGVVIFVTLMNTLPRYLLPNFGAPSTAARFQSMLEVETDPSGATRFAIWANSLAIFKDHPILGVGKGNFQFYYPLYNRRVTRDPSFTVEEKAAEAHNDYIQLLAETGILGAAGFFWILFLLAKKSWQSISEKDLHLSGIVFALTAILAEAFWDFPFEHAVPTAFFWIYAGILWSAGSEHSRTLTRTPSRGITLAVAALLVVGCTAASIFSFMHFRAEYYYSRAVNGAYDTQNIPEKIDWARKDFDQAIRLYPFDYRYYYWLGVLEMRSRKGESALRATLQALSLNPYHINTLNNLGVVYTYLGNLPKAIQAFETALRIWPYYVNVQNNLGQIYEKTGAKEKAVEAFRNTLQIDPKNKLARDKLAALLGQQ